MIARLARYGPECRRVLRLLALAGRPLDRDELADTAAAFELTSERLPPRSSTLPRRGDGALDPDLAAGLEEALAAGILVEDDAGIAFRHEHIRRAAATDLLPRLRHRHHLALAAGLVAHPSEAATHWLAAHVPDRAFAAAVDAAGRAEATHAPEDALMALELALGLVDPAASWADGSRPARTAREAPRPASPAHRAGGAPHRPRRGARTAASGSRRSARSRRRSSCGPPSRRSRPAGRPAPWPISRRSSDRSTSGATGWPSACSTSASAATAVRPATGPGALAALERAVDLIPDAPTLERATVLAALAQATMVDGSFAKAERLAREAMRIGVGLRPRGRVDRRPRDDDPRRRARLGRRARGRRSRCSRRPVAWPSRPAIADELFRVFANLTTVLDLVGRRTEAVAIAYEGIEASRKAGLEAVYGNLLRGNASDSLTFLGRWDESRAISATGLEWSPAGVAFARPIDNLAIIEIETMAGESAGRGLGQMLVELETVSDAQHAVPIYRAAASLALWQGDHADAGRAAGRGWDLVNGSGDWSLVAKMAATVAEVDSMAAADAATRRDLATLATIRGRARQRREGRARRRSPSRASGRRSARAARPMRGSPSRRPIATASRVATTRPRWDRIAKAWEGLANPYEVAKARWREAEAILAAGEGRVGRGRARLALEEAARIGLDLSAPAAAPRGPRARRAGDDPAPGGDRRPARRAGWTDGGELAASHGRWCGRRPRRGRAGAGRNARARRGRGGRGPAAGPSGGTARPSRRSPAASSASRPSRSATRSACRGASARSSPSSRRAGRTARSASGCSSARRRSGSTSGTSSPSSACPDGSRPPPSRSGSG